MLMKHALYNVNIFKFIEVCFSLTYSLTCGLSWRIFYMYLKVICILSLGFIDIGWWYFIVFYFLVDLLGCCIHYWNLKLLLLNCLFFTSRVWGSFVMCICVCNYYITLMRRPAFSLLRLFVLNSIYLLHNH